jgi:hypothetical protein
MQILLIKWPIPVIRTCPFASLRRSLWTAMRRSSGNIQNLGLFELWAFKYKHSCWKGNMSFFCENACSRGPSFSHTSYMTLKHISDWSTINYLQNECLCHLFDWNGEWGAFLQTWWKKLWFPNEARFQRVNFSPLDICNLPVSRFSGHYYVPDGGIAKLG